MSAMKHLYTVIEEMLSIENLQAQENAPRVAQLQAELAPYSHEMRIKAIDVVVSYMMEDMKA